MTRSTPKSHRPPTATAAELELFHTALRDAKPLAPRHAARRKHRDSVAPRREAAKPTNTVTVKESPPVRPPIVAKRAAPNPGLDRRTAERLRRGEIPIERRLDLHGMTQADAHAALDHFVRRAWTDGKRMLLVITGKGGTGTGGVLRTGVPRWLAAGENAARVLRVESAQARHGGGGAYYVLLRRRREEA